MDFRSLVDSSVQVEATMITLSVVATANTEKLLIKEVYVNGEYFRDHVWIKNTKKLKVLSKGDKFTATATLIEYASIDGKKFGLRSFKSVVVDKEELKL